MRWWLIGLAACSSPIEYGVEYDGTRMPVVDLHLHPGEWENIPDATQDLLATRFPFPLGLDAPAVADNLLSAQNIAAELDKGGVALGGLFAVYAPRSVGISPNEYVASVVNELPDRFFGLASLQIDDWNTREPEELQRLRDGLAQPNMIGVKLAHAHMHMRFDDPAYWSIYDVAAEANAPVYLHTGSSPFPGIQTQAPYTDPAYLRPAIVAHPDTIFILGHLGHDFLNKKIGKLDTCIDLARSYANVYLEPSALGSDSSDPDGDNLTESLRRIREAGLVDRIIYGSDGPQSPGFVASYLEGTIEAMERAGYTAEEAQAVLAGNFADVFGREVPPP